MNGQYSISEQKQWETKVKVKQTDSTWGQILFFPVTRMGSGLQVWLSTSPRYFL